MKTKYYLMLLIITGFLAYIASPTVIGLFELPLRGEFDLIYLTYTDILKARGIVTLWVALPIMGAILLHLAGTRKAGWSSRKSTLFALSQVIFFTLCSGINVAIHISTLSENLQGIDISPTIRALTYISGTIKNSLLFPVLLQLPFVGYIIYAWRAQIKKQKASQ